MGNKQDLSGFYCGRNAGLTISETAEYLVFLCTIVSHRMMGKCRTNNRAQRETRRNGQLFTARISKKHLSAQV